MERKTILQKNRSGKCTSLLSLLRVTFLGNALLTFCSLASILQKRVLAPAKLDEIKIKANVLAAFAAEKVAEARDTIERAAEEL
jgi:hypothetical protein